MVKSYPEYDESTVFAQESADMEKVIDAIKAIRTRRAEMNVVPSRKAKVFIVTPYGATFGEKVHPFFVRLASASEVEVVDSYDDDSSVRIITDAAAIYIPLADIIDFEAERARLTAELKTVEGEIARANGKLSNENFTSRAPEAVVNAEREKLERYKAKLAGIEDALKAIEGK